MSAIPYPAGMSGVLSPIPVLDGVTLHGCDVAAIWAAVHAIRRQCLVVRKRNANKALGSNYADLGDLMEVLQPALGAHGLAVACEPGGIRMAEGVMIQCLTLSVTMEGQAGRIERPCEWAFPGDIVSGRTGGSAVNVAQRQGMANTYATRNVIGRFFHCIFGDDDDAQKLGIARERQEGGAVSDSAPWGSLMDGGWRDAMAPDGIPLGDKNNAQRKSLWEKDLSSKPLMAWVGDLITDMLQEAGWSWARLAEWAACGLPATLESCTPAQLNTAAARAKQIPDQG